MTEKKEVYFMKKYPVIVVGLFIIWACAPRPAQAPAETPEEEVVIIGEETPAPETTEETPAPVTEEIEEAPVTEEGELTLEEATPAPETPTPSEEVTTPSGPVYGYRVQILAASMKENADKFAAEAQARFPDQKVYVEFIPPYYKVRIGDFLTREEAESFKAKVRSLGYFDAFIVESQVNPPR